MKRNYYSEVLYFIVKLSEIKYISPFLNIKQYTNVIFHLTEIDVIAVNAVQ